MLCVYTPNRTDKDKSILFSTLRATFKLCKTCLLGDFNCVCRVQDRATTNRLYDRSASFWNTSLDEYELEYVAETRVSRNYLRFAHFKCHLKHV